MRNFYPISYLFLIVACSQPNQQNEHAVKSIPASDAKPMAVIDTCPLEMQLIKAGLVNVKMMIPSILVDLKYSSTSNFLGADVYGELENAYLQPIVVQMLKKALEILQSRNAAFTFLVFDAARPLYVQQKMWDMVEMPIGEKTKYLSNPKQGSVHNYGAAIDLTLATLNGKPVDMGTDFDYFGDLAQPKLETHLLATGKLTEVQISNRKLLRLVMEEAGFRQLPTEWWHYNAYSRAETKKRFQQIK